MQMFSDYLGCMKKICFTKRNSKRCRGDLNKKPARLPSVLTSPKGSALDSESETDPCPAHPGIHRGSNWRRSVTDLESDTHAE